MKLLLCFVLALALGVHSRPHQDRSHHASLGPERECLSEANVETSKVMRHVHTVSDVNDEEVGRYLACVWKKRQMINDNRKVNGENIFRYLKDIYHKENLSDSNEAEMRDASKECAKLEDNSEKVLAVKVKNCIIEAVAKMPFLTQPKPRPSS
uniref:Uncharacterized protein n=1 Tax=Photinus pyralis TaxID=7054 RepID=A0A1Y1KWQ2_PHOPY